MKVKKFWFIAIFVILVVAALSICLCNQKEDCIKILKLDELPEKVVEKLGETALSRGVYIFTANFVDDIYIAICGGESYNESYDVDIKDFVSEFGWSGRDYYRLLNKAEYKISIVENSETKVDYVHNFSTPLVVFKLLQPEHAYKNNIDVITNNEKLDVNKWWGQDALKGERSEFTYEVIQKKDDIPEEIWSKIETMEFEETPDGRLYVFTKPYTAHPLDVGFGDIDPEGGFYDGFEQYILIHGEANDSEYFNVVFEDVKMLPKDFYGRYYLYLRKMENDKKRFKYSEGFDRAFIILKIADKVGRLNPKRMVPNINLIGNDYSLLNFKYKRVYVVY